MTDEKIFDLMEQGSPGMFVTHLRARTGNWAI